MRGVPSRFISFSSSRSLASPRPASPRFVFPPSPPPPLPASPPRATRWHPGNRRDPEVLHGKMLDDLRSPGCDAIFSLYGRLCLVYRFIRLRRERIVAITMTHSPSKCHRGEIERHYYYYRQHFSARFTRFKIVPFLNVAVLNKLL